MSKCKVFRKIIVYVCLLFLVLAPHTFAKEATALLKIIPEISENDVFVAVKYTSNDMCGGSFNFIYDTKNLELISVKEGETIKGVTHFINSKYADGVIRINWASTKVLPAEGTLINIELKMLNESFDKAYVSIDKLKIVNSEDNKILSEYQVEYTAPEQNNTVTDKDAVDSDSPSTEPETDKGAVDDDLPSAEPEPDKDTSDSESPSEEPETDKDAVDGDSPSTKPETDKDAVDDDLPSAEPEPDKDTSDSESPSEEPEPDKDTSDSDSPSEEPEPDKDTSGSDSPSEEPEPDKDTSDSESPSEKPEPDKDSVGSNLSSAGTAINSSGLKQEAEANKIEDMIEFADVNKNDWFYNSVQYVIENKLMNGVAEGEFAPDEPLTRAMLVTVLYRNSGEPAVNKSTPFADVDMGTWYADAVVWARQHGIVNGVNETDFAPDKNITREQIAVILFRYAQYKSMDAVTLEENLHFTDVDKISEYAVSAMNWAVGAGLMKGRTATTINPQDNATRAEIAAILQRFIESNK